MLRRSNGTIIWVKVYEKSKKSLGWKKETKEREAKAWWKPYELMGSSVATMQCMSTSRSTRTRAITSAVDGSVGGETMREFSGASSRPPRMPNGTIFRNRLTMR